VSPWGELLAEGGVQPAVIVADVELQLLEDIRRRVPSLQHDRAFDVVHAAQETPDKVVS
jgi:deaminated glutathione amidase